MVHFFPKDDRGLGALTRVWCSQNPNLCQQKSCVNSVFVDLALTDFDSECCKQNFIPVCIFLYLHQIHEVV